MHDDTPDTLYKCGCSFTNEDGQAHVYDCGGIGENSFTKTELMSIYLSQLISRHQIKRAAYRDIVRFINTVIRDYKEIESGKYIDSLLALYIYSWHIAILHY